MENLPHFFKDSIKNESAIKLPKTFAAVVDTRDIGKSAAALLSSNGEGHNEKYYEMNGPEVLTGDQMAKTLSSVLGKEIKYTELPKDAWKAFPAAIVEIFEYVSEKGQNAIPFTQDVKNLTGQNGSFEQFVRDHQDSFK